MRAIGLALAASAALAASDAPAQEKMLSAADVITRLVEESDSGKRDAWYDADVKGKAVTWVAPVFNTSTTFGNMIVNTRPIERGLIACGVPKRFEAAVKKVEKGETVLCAGRIDNYERMMGVALVNVTADTIVIGKDNIEAWEKARKK